jgi:RNA-directed DNA polymerase
MKNRSSTKLLPKEPLMIVNPTEFKEMQQKVDKLQCDIVSALKDSNENKANRLATILVRSKAAHVVSLHRLLTNKGFRSPGWSTPNTVPKTNSEYSNLLNQLKDIISKPTEYKAQPLYRIYLPKKVPGKFRPISVPSYIDRLVQKKRSGLSLSFRPFCRTSS